MKHEEHHARAWPIVGLVVGLSLGAPAGCLRFDAFRCQQDSECMLQSTQGQCLAAEQICVYPDDTCPSQWSSAGGSCMPSPSATGTASATGSITPADDPPVDDDASTGTSPEDPTAAGTDEGTTTEPVSPADSSSSGDAVLDCFSQPLIPLTSEGVVEASSTFNDEFRAFLSADGLYETSWFSSGPEDNAEPSLYEWTVLQPRCIGRVRIVGNGLHQNPDFRDDFGFESVVVRVYDEQDMLVFQQMRSMLGTPDPTITVEPNVMGVRIVLELSEHESNNCGGFSELEIEGW